MKSFKLQKNKHTSEAVLAIIILSFIAIIMEVGLLLVDIQMASI